MHRFLYTCLLLLYIASFSFGQSPKHHEEVGYFVDHDNMTIDGFLDFTYNPKRKTTYTLTIGRDFTYGHYYDLQGRKMEGKIKYSHNNNYIYFKSGEETEIKITPEECTAYVIGMDSFVVINNFYIERLAGIFKYKKPEFAEVIKKINKVTFYEYIRKSGDNQVDYYLCRRDNDTFVCFSPDRHRFKETANEYFGHIDYLKEKIADATYKQANILQLIKYSDYSNKLANHKKIYFTDSWEEIQDTSDYTYYGIITQIYEDIVKIHYYTRNGSLIYKGQYTSLFPLEKDGNFSWYYVNGVIRKNVVYKKNKVIDSIVDYYPDGKIHYVYVLKREQNQKYKTIYDTHGKSILDEEGNGRETFYDSVMFRKITRVYTNFKLENSSYVSQNGKTIYQTCDKNSRYIFESSASTGLQDFKYPKSSFLKYNHGLVLVSFLTDEEGNTTDIKIIKGVDKELDKKVLEHCLAKYKGKAWTIAKVDKVAVPEEIIVSYLFELKGFSRYKNTYYYNNLWQQQMMMQQQMIQPVMRPPGF